MYIDPYIELGPVSYRYRRLPFAWGRASLVGLQCSSVRAMAEAQAASAMPGQVFSSLMKRYEPSVGKGNCRQLQGLPAGDDNCMLHQVIG